MAFGSMTNVEEEDGEIVFRHAGLVLRLSKKFKLSSEETYAALLLGGAMVFVWGGTVWVLLIELVRRYSRTRE
jgi:hypothetical protein